MPSTSLLPGGPSLFSIATRNQSQASCSSHLLRVLPIPHHRSIQVLYSRRQQQDSFSAPHSAASRVPFCHPKGIVKYTRRCFEESDFRLLAAVFARQLRPDQFCHQGGEDFNRPSRRVTTPTSRNSHSARKAISHLWTANHHFSKSPPASDICAPVKPARRKSSKHYTNEQQSSNHTRKEKYESESQVWKTPTNQDSEKGQGLPGQKFLCNPIRTYEERGTRTTVQTVLKSDNGLRGAPPNRVQEISPEDSIGQKKDMTKPDSATGGHDKPLVVGRTKPTETTTPSAETNQALNHAMEENIQANTRTAAPAEEADSATPSESTASSKPNKKEKAPKQPKQPKAAPPAAPLTPALIDLRVGHILRAIAHPNADSLFVSTIAMGDAEDADHTHKDEETGKIVRTVCSGLNGLIPLEEMQDRKIVVVANLKPVTMRGIKSAAMVLAASPRVAEGEDDHAADRTVELVIPPAESEAGDKVYFEGWPYGDGRGPEKQLNPKKKVWEAIQPGFYTSEELVVGFDAKASEVGGEEKGDLVVEGKGGMQGQDAKRCGCSMRGIESVEGIAGCPSEEASTPGKAQPTRNRASSC